MEIEELKNLMLKAVKDYIETKIRQLGTEIVKCKKCNKEMFWLKSKNGKMIPTCLDLTNHFIDCPFSKEFKK